MKNKVIAAKRNRRGLARLIASIVDYGPINVSEAHDSARRQGRALLILDGSAHFDVYTARELGVRMIAMGAKQTEFERWTSGQGLGPENQERGAFVRVETACEWITPEEWERRGHPQPSLGFCGEIGVTLRGGWPGKLARAYAKAGGKRSVAMGRSLARQGQRLLDALDGQPSECQACDGDGDDLSYSRSTGEVESVGPCPDCHGTGHNLRGVLPTLKWSPAVRRKVSDSVLAAAEHDIGQRLTGDQLSWTHHLLAGGGIEYPDASGIEHTRVVPRAEHHHYGVRCVTYDLDRRISERMWDAWGDDWHEVPLPPGTPGPRKRVRKKPEPSWYRGELYNYHRRAKKIKSKQRLDRISERNNNEN